MRFVPFPMERWQSTWEHRVRFNLSESGVHPLTVAELVALSEEVWDPGDVLLGYGQSNGSIPLRERIATLYPNSSPDRIVVTTGGAEANFLAAWHLLEPGGRAGVLLPTYGQLPGLLESFGVEVVPVHLRPELGWQPDPDELAAAFRKGLRFFLVTHPNNPTGSVLPESTVQRIVDLAGEHGSWVVADEVYRGAEIEGPPSATFQGRGDQVLVTHSLSKAFGLPGLRIGWAEGPPDVVADLWARSDYTTIAPASLSDRLARVALEPRTRERLLARTRGILQENLQLFSRWADGLGSAVHLHRPAAGAIALLEYRAPFPSLELAERLRRDHDVLVVPGTHFGLEGMLRIGFGPLGGELLPALERLGTALKS